MSYVRCIFSASKDMTINIKLFPIYSNSYGHAYDAMFAHDIAATFASDRVRVCGDFRRYSLCVCALGRRRFCGSLTRRSYRQFSSRRFCGSSTGRSHRQFSGSVSVGRLQGGIRD